MLRVQRAGSFLPEKRAVYGIRRKTIALCHQKSNPALPARLSNLGSGIPQLQNTKTPQYDSPEYAMAGVSIAPRNIGALDLQWPRTMCCATCSTCTNRGRASVEWLAGERHMPIERTLQLQVTSGEQTTPLPLAFDTLICGGFSGRNQ